MKISLASDEVMGSFRGTKPFCNNKGIQFPKQFPKASAEICFNLYLLRELRSTQH